MLKLGRHQLRTPAVCGSVIGEEIGNMAAGMSLALEQGADLIELRLDGLRGLVGWKKLLRTDSPIILTNRAEREGGRFGGEERERVEPLLEGIVEKVACVDVELSTPRQLLGEVVSEARKRDVSILMSYHDFAATPKVDAMMGIAEHMVRAGCDVAKIVTFAREPRDSLTVLDFLIRASDELGAPVVTFAMGEAGRLSRIAAPILGSPIAYAAVGEATAPGQFDVATTKRLLRELGLGDES
ncbi:MAG: type I 3-dehydroquinate dehydratase [Candidatus Hodarchaeaceae archaeon]|nr:type I 3-dehydroquinate dehydratase [Candidatus Hodarchaeaceae archaeon]